MRPAHARILSYQYRDKRINGRYDQLHCHLQAMNGDDTDDSEDVISSMREISLMFMLPYHLAVCSVLTLVISFR